MKLHCREVQQSLRAFHADNLTGEFSSAVKAHLSRCEACRHAARQEGLAKLLRTAARAPVPEPSDFFMTRLHGALADCPAPQPSAAMAELLLRAGLRLAPAMAALVLLLSIGSAYLVKPHDPALAAVPAEELLLDNHPLNVDLVLAAITGDTIER